MVQLARTGLTQNKPPPPSTLLGGGGGGVNYATHGARTRALALCIPGVVGPGYIGGVWTAW